MAFDLLPSDCRAIQCKRESAGWSGRQMNKVVSRFTSMHPTIQRAIDAGITTFVTEDGEWDLHLESYPLVDSSFGGEVLIFANNGGGDYLFIPAQDVTIETPRIYTYWHEGPEVTQLEERLPEVLGLHERPPSNTAIPTYATGEQMALGDNIEYKSFFCWKTATISYVPGISKRDPALEYDGSRQALLRKANGGDYTLTIDNETNSVIGKIRFISRADG